jgi:hypothetical protein
MTFIPSFVKIGEPVHELKWGAQTQANAGRAHHRVPSNAYLLTVYINSAVEEE